MQRSSGGPSRLGNRIWYLIWNVVPVVGRIAHHRQIADIVLVELDFELLLERLSVEAGDLAVDLVDQRRGHAVVDDRVEADLRQRMAQLGRGMIERPGSSAR